jgi:hypothetical protein
VSAGNFLDACFDRLERTAFRASTLLFAWRERLSAWRDRMPGAGLPASTVLAYAAVGIMAAILVDDLIGPTPAVSSVSPAQPLRPIWTEITRAHPSFALELPALDPASARYLALRHRGDGGRRDEISWGAPYEPGVFARVSLSRPGADGAVEYDPLEAVAQAAMLAKVEGELVERQTTLDTKFGRLALVDMTVKGTAGLRTCLAAAGAWNKPRFALVAWRCNDGPEILAHGDLACMLDRLALIGAGGDDGLARFFAGAELRRAHCGTHRPLISPTPQLTQNWISNKAGTRLRGPLARR